MRLWSLHPFWIRRGWLLFGERLCLPRRVAVHGVKPTLVLRAAARWPAPWRWLLQLRSFRSLPIAARRIPLALGVVARFLLWDFPVRLNLASPEERWLGRLRISSPWVTTTAPRRRQSRRRLLRSDIRRPNALADCTWRSPSKSVRTSAGLFHRASLA